MRFQIIALSFADRSSKNPPISLIQRPVQNFMPQRPISSLHAKRNMLDTQQIRVAVLYQALDAPVIRGVQKPVKHTRYRDAGTDILFALRSKLAISIVTPHPTPNPDTEEDWCFPDTESGILSAIDQGATHLWLQTIVFATHPLQVSSKLDGFASKIQIIGQPPLLVEIGDDKDCTNNLIRKELGVPMPRSWSIEDTQEVASFIAENSLPFPVVAKPVRGRGSQGVKVCKDKESLLRHLEDLFQDSPLVLLEEFLSGEEATITVMSPSGDHSNHWALPVVTRFNHVDDIAPYNGVVAVTENSRVVTEEEEKTNQTYVKVARDCEKVAKLLNATAPIRIDIRRFREDLDSSFALFDINMKPNMTGPGRPGRDHQASLTLLAAMGLGWDFPALLLHMLDGAQSLETLRKAEVVGK